MISNRILLGDIQSIGWSNIHQKKVEMQIESLGNNFFYLKGDKAKWHTIWYCAPLNNPVSKNLDFLNCFDFNLSNQT
jgi:hypothetical protein